MWDLPEWNLKYRIKTLDDVLGNPEITLLSEESSLNYSIANKEV